MSVMAVTVQFREGLMMNSGDEDGQPAYVLTASGEEYVNSMSERKALSNPMRASKI